MSVLLLSTAMSSPSNGLVCFTNCLLPREDGSLVEKDLWIDERRGVILDAQVGRGVRDRKTYALNHSNAENVLLATRKTRQDRRPGREHPQVNDSAQLSLRMKSLTSRATTVQGISTFKSMVDSVSTFLSTRATIKYTATASSWSLSGSQRPASQRSFQPSSYVAVVPSSGRVVLLTTF